jgi:16S rRNA (cytosine967-C5)-methyltransferase
MQNKKQTKTKEQATAAGGYRGRITAYRALHRVLHGGAFSNIVLGNALDDASLAPGDRRTATFLVLGVLRNLALLDAVFRSKTSKGKITAAPALLLAARMAIFEILFQNKIPKYATISEYMKIAAAECSKSETKFLNACLRRVSHKDMHSLLEDAETDLRRMALEFSCPEWFAQSAVKFYGMDDTLKMLRANNLGMPSYFRTNPLRVSEDELSDMYARQRVDTAFSKRLPNCVYFKVGQGYHPAREVRAGLLTPQDFSTQIVAHAVAPQPGDSVLDLCCGRGAKATHLAELMGNRGRVLACDIHAHKTEIAAGEAERLGVSILETRVCDATDPGDMGSFDRVLVDAPCTGTGTFRRRPELKQRVRPAQVMELAFLQRRMLEAAARLVAPGGRLVYATCSVLPEENDDVAAEFLERHEDFAPARNEPALEHLPQFKTPFGSVFLPQHTQACGAAVCILDRKS